MKILTKISPKEKRFLLAGALAVLVYVVYVHVMEPAIVSQAEVRKQIQTKREMLERYRAPVPGREYYQAKIQQMSARSGELEALLLKETRAPLAAARLQDLLHKIGQETGLTIVRENVLSPKKPEIFGEVAVELSIRGEMRSFRDFLYRIQTGPYLMTLPKLIIRRGSGQTESAIAADLQVAGYMPREETK